MPVRRAHNAAGPHAFFTSPRAPAPLCVEGPRALRGGQIRPRERSMKHKFARRLGAALFAMTLAASRRPQVEWNHNSESDIGPSSGIADLPLRHLRLAVRPGGTDAGAGRCRGGQEADPRRLVTTATQLAALPALAFLYKPTPFVVDNTGHVVEVPMPPETTCGSGSILRAAPVPLPRPQRAHRERPARRASCTWCTVTSRASWRSWACC